MGLALSNNYATTVQNIMNNTLQQIDNKCVNKCGNKSSDVTFVIEDSANVSVDLDQTCAVLGTSCTARTYLETDITNNLSAVTQQKNTNDSNYLMWTFSDNDTSISQTIRNNVSQMVNNFCENVVDNSEDNLFFYVKNSRNVSVNFAQNGSVNNTQCSFDVTAKISLMNQESAKIQQSNKNVGLLADLVIILGIVFGIAVLFFLVFMLKGGKGGNTQSQLCDESNSDSCEKEIQSLARYQQ